VYIGLDGSRDLWVNQVHPEVVPDPSDGQGFEFHRDVLAYRFTLGTGFDLRGVHPVVMAAMLLQHASGFPFSQESIDYALGKAHELV
jgi:hypothetical protein